MPAIRTVAVATPAVVVDLLRQFAGRRVKLDIATVLSSRGGLAARLRRLRPDLVIIGLPFRQGSLAIEQVLLAVPTAKVIALSKGPERLAGYELRLHRTDLAGVAPGVLIAFVRRVQSQRIRVPVSIFTPSRDG